MNIKLSICCLTYNHEKYCEEAIRSIWEENRKDFEIVVVDDGSTDNTLNILNNLKLISPIKMTLITQKNIFKIGYSLNKAIKESSGEFLTFFSLDDYFKKNSLSNGLKMIDGTEYQFLALICNDPKKTCLAIDDYNRISNNPTIQNLLEAEKYAGIWTTTSIFRKNLIDTIGGFEKNMTGDDIVLRTKIMLYMLKNPQLKFKATISEPLHFYRIHENNIHKKIDRQCKILQEVMEKYFPGEKSYVLQSWIDHRDKTLPKNKFLNYYYKIKNLF
jgi:glycosyltransferase involved in cell wall biosynthesis